MTGPGAGGRAAESPAKSVRPSGYITDPSTLLRAISHPKSPSSFPLQKR